MAKIKAEHSEVAVEEHSDATEKTDLEETVERSEGTVGEDLDQTEENLHQEVVTVVFEVEEEIVEVFRKVMDFPTTIVDLVELVR